jgi:ribosomal protein S18 acetylase RimI-like enzyme
VARLVMNMYNDTWLEMFGPNACMTLEEARKAVAIDLLVQDTRVLVVEHSADNSLVGFISYAIRYGGVFFIEYEWVEKEYANYGFDDKLFQSVEEGARKAGENATYIRVSHREKRLIEFLKRRGYETINMLELVK